MTQVYTRRRIVAAFLVAPLGGFLLWGACMFVVMTFDGRIKYAPMLIVVTGYEVTFGSPVAYLVQLALIGAFGAVPKPGRAGLLRTLAIGASAGLVVMVGLTIFFDGKPNPLMTFLGTLLGGGSALTYCAALRGRDAANWRA